MTDQHTADTEYDQQYAPHGNGDYHHAPPDHPPAPVRPLLTLSEPSPRPSRAWPLTARLAVAVLIIALAAVTAMSLISIRTATAKASQASQLASAEAVSLGSMGRELAALQAKVATPAKVYRPPAIYQHYGFCVSFSRNTGNGDLVDINLTAPQGSYACGQGNFVSVVPGG